MDDIKPSSSRRSHTYRTTSAQSTFPTSTAKSKQPPVTLDQNPHKKSKKRTLNLPINLKRSSFKKYAVSLTLIFMALIATFYFVSEGAQAAVTVDTSTAAAGAATQYSQQRKTWHDGTRYWSAFSNGSDIEFWYSSDGSSWSQNASATISGYSGLYDFSIEADSSNAFIVLNGNSGANVGKAGSYPGTSFTWTVEASVLTPAETLDYVDITRDSNNKLWVVARSYEDSFGHYKIIAVRSTNANDISAWDTQDDLYDSTTSISNTDIVSLGSGDMAITYKYNSNAVYSTKYTNGVGWDTSPTVVSATASGDEKNQSIISKTSSDESYMSFIDSGGKAKFKKYTDKQGGDGVNINDASDSNFGGGSKDNIVRDSGGNLYSFLASNSDDKCRLWKSSDNGASWSEQDSSDAPYLSLNTCYPVDMAVDSVDTLHIIYNMDDGSEWTNQYITFSGGQYGTAESMPSLARTRSASISIDSSNKPHVVQIDSSLGQFVDYTNRVSGSWSSLITLESGLTTYYSPNITISEDNIPEIAYINYADSDLTTAVGNANNATSFTLQDVDTNVQPTGLITGTSIGVDIDGNTWVAYVDENGASDYVTLVKHNDADAWSTWQTPVTNSNVGSEPSIAISDNTVYIGYQNSTDDIALDTYNGSWGGENILKTGTYSDVSLRWSNYHNYQHGPLDFVYSDGTDAFYSNTGYWQNGSTLDSNSGNAYTTITRSTANDDLYAYWIRSNNIYYSKSSSPYTSWSAASSLYSTGTNVWLTSAATTSNCTIPYIWTSGTGSPYDVKFASQAISGCEPTAPTLSSPANATSVVSTTPALQMASTDPQSDTIKYKVYIYNTSTNNGTTCSGSSFETADQNSSGTGWNNGTTAYASGATATYTVQATMTRGNSYCWQAEAKDPGGTNTFGPLSTPSTFTINSTPDAPTLVSPANVATGVAVQPTFQMTSNDADGDYLRYKIQVCSNSDCSSVLRTIDQTSSQTGWTGQDTQTSTAYLESSTASHTYQTPILSERTQYWWRAYVIDPAGVNSWSSTSSIFSFTTTGTTVNIRGGVNLQGGVNLNP